MITDQHEAVLYPEWHPCLPNPTREEVDGMIRDLGFEQYSAWLANRTRSIQMADHTHTFADGSRGEPVSHGFELPHWARADRLVREADIGVYTAGGKRASKSEWCAKRFVQSALAFPRSLKWALQANLNISRQTQQKHVWKFLPNHIKKLNGKSRHGMAKINYSLDGGFTEEVLVLPNETEIHFLTFKQDPEDFQGGELGAYLDRRMEEEMGRNPHLHNIGAWIDENCPVNWVTTCEMRCASRKAKVIWTYSTMNGITAAIKEVIGTPRTIESRRAELLEPGIKHVPDCPPGHMPFVQECTRKGWKAIYFHTDLNLFGNNYSGVKERCEGKSFPYIAENAYGWSEDTRSRAWPMFGPWNIVKPEEVPAEGTNYFYTDPAGTRNWASFWARVCPGNPGDIYIYRDWPDEQRYGQWAEMDGRINPNPDGAAGRAQRSLGYGFSMLKQAWLSCERILVPETIRTATASATAEGNPHPGPLPSGRTGEGEAIGSLEALVTRLVGDAQHCKRILAAIENGENLEELAEEIFRNYIDPRAGRNSTMTQEKGGTCAIDELRKEHTTALGTIVPARYFVAAPGLDVDEGIRHVTKLLEWDRTQNLCPLVNAPRLYVSENCRQVIWCLSNYTGTGGEMGGCKDFADLLRYLATSAPKYLPPGALEVTGGGSY